MIRKNLKKLQLVKPEPIHPIWSQAELLSRMQEAATRITSATIRGPGNWVIMGTDVARQFDEAMSDYTVTMGEFRVEDDTYVQDITINPQTTTFYANLDFNVLPTGGNFYNSASTITYSWATPNT